jgi:hypothetical protein
MDPGTDLSLKKKQYAVELAEKYLAEYGIKVGIDLIDSMIEAQVLRLKAQFEGKGEAV